MRGQSGGCERPTQHDCYLGAAARDQLGCALIVHSNKSGAMVLAGRLRALLREGHELMERCKCWVVSGEEPAAVAWGRI